MKARGCFTQDKFIAGRSLKEIETNIGFREGRLSQGGIVLALTQLPMKVQFHVAGYTNVSLHNFVIGNGLDANVLERNAMAQWELTGPNRLVKVLPAIPYEPGLDPDEQYPRARGIPQWLVLVEMPCIVAGVLSTYPKEFIGPQDKVRIFADVASPPSQQAICAGSVPAAFLAKMYARRLWCSTSG